MAAPGYQPIRLASGKRGGFETTLPPGQLGPGQALSRRQYQKAIGKPLPSKTKPFTLREGPAGPEYVKEGNPLRSVKSLRKEIDGLPRSRCVHILIVADLIEFRGGKADSPRRPYQLPGEPKPGPERAVQSQILTHKLTADHAADAQSMTQFAQLVLGSEVKGVRSVTLRPVACGDTARAQQYREHASRPKISNYFRKRYGIKDQGD